MALDSLVQTYTLELISSSVTILYLGLYRGSFGINWILSMFPSLVKLYINPPGWGNRLSLKPKIKRQYGVTTRGTNEVQPVKVHSKLRFLSIKKTYVHPRLLDFIKIAAPNLDHFDLNACVSFSKQSTPSMSLKHDLSSWNLKEFDITLERQPIEIYVRCNVTIQNVSKCILAKMTRGSLELLDSDDEIILDEISLEVKLNPVTHVKILGFSILKDGDSIVIDS